MKLYGIAGSRALRSLWAAEEVGVEYEHVPTHFLGDSKKPEYLAINPNGRVPALVDGDVTLFESMAINLYLARKYGGALWPSNEADEARAIQWSFWGMSEIEPNLMDILLNRIMLPEDQRNEAVAEAAENGLDRPMKVLDDTLADRTYLLGNDFTIADLNVAAVLSMAKLVRYDTTGCANAHRWFEACTGRESFARARQL